MSTPDRISVGVVGCGTIAQLAHIPNLVDMPQFRLDALVDTTAVVRDELGSKYGVDATFSNVEGMLESTDIDAAIVSTPTQTHVEIGTTILEEDCDLFLEKPLAMTREGAETLLMAERRSDGVAMVGYMKRFDVATEQLFPQLDRLEEIDLVTAYDTDPDHEQNLDEMYDIVRPEKTNPDGERLRKAKRAITTEDKELAQRYAWQLDHAIHDVNLLNAVFGTVEEIQHVEFAGGGRYLTAILEYEDGVTCRFEMGKSDRKWFEEFVRVDGPNGKVRLEFPDPYRRHTTAELVSKFGNETIEETSFTGSFQSNFKRELEHFADCIRTREQPRTTFSEAAEDLDVVIELFEAYQRRQVDE